MLWSGLVWVRSADPITRVDEVRLLPRTESITNNLVRLSGVITYFDPVWWSCFFADQTAGIYLDFEQEDVAFEAGERLDIEGYVQQGGFAPSVKVTRFDRRGRGEALPLRRPSIDLLLKGGEDSQWIELDGLVHSVNFSDPQRSHLIIQLSYPTTEVTVVVPNPKGDLRFPENLVDAEVRVRGVCGMIYNQNSRRPGDHHPSGFRLHASSMSQVEILKPANPDPFTLPERRLDRVLEFNPRSDLGHRVKVRGLVAVSRSDGVLFLQRDQNGIRVELSARQSIEVGSELEVVGFPKPSLSGPVLAHSLVRKTGVLRSVPVMALDDPELEGRQAGLMVSAQGSLVDWYGQGRDTVVNLRRGNQAFEVIYENPHADVAWLETLVPGALLEVTGVNSVPYDSQQVAQKMQIFVQGREAFRVLDRGPWLEDKRVRYALLALVPATFMALLWVRLLRRRVTTQTAQIRQQYLEKHAVEQRFQDLAENANDAIYTLSPQGQFTSVNQAAERLVGYTREQLLRMNFRDLVVEDQWPMTLEHIERKMRGVEERDRFEVDILTRTRERLTIEVSSRATLTSGILIEIQGVARDITDRKRAEKAVQTSEARLQALAKGTASSWGVSFFEDLVTHLAKVFGVRFVEVTELVGGGGGIVRTLAVCNEAKPMENMEFELNGTPAATVIREGVCAFPDGVQARFPQDRFLAGMNAVGYLGVCIRAANSEPVGTLVVVDDKPLADVESIRALLQIFAARAGVELERLRFETTLRRNEERYRSLVSSLAEGVILQDAQGSILEANENACQILGLDRDQLMARRTIGPEWRTVREDGSIFPSTEYPVMLSATTGRSYRNVIMGVWISGDRLRWISINSQPVRGGDGYSVVAAVASFEDITEVRTASIALRESEERYRLLVENSTDILSELDHDGCLVYVSPNALTILGYHPSELLHQRVLDGVHPDEVDRLKALFGAHTDGSASHRYRHRQGKWLWFESSVRWFRNPSGEVRIAAVSRDITSRVATEQVHDALQEQLRQSQKLEAIGTLAGGIAHDFNNIMGGILGNAELVQGSLAPSHPAQFQLAQIVQAILRAREVVRQLLTYSRKKEDLRQEMSLQKVVAEAVELLRAALPSTIEIEQDLGETSIPIMAHSAQIHQVVMNLGVNASQAMMAAKRSGTLRVGCDFVEVSADLAARHARLRSGTFARFFLADEGHGMPSEVVDRIFEPFFTTKPVGEGTGLGLSVVHGIVRSHGGVVLVQSRVGAGTTFEVLLPLLEREGSGGRELLSLMPRGVGEFVLWVEEDSLSADLIEWMLRVLGYTPSVFTSAKEAMEAIRSNPTRYQLVVAPMRRGTVETGAGDVVGFANSLNPFITILRTSDEPMEQGDHRKRVLRKPFSLQQLSTTLRLVLRQSGHDVYSKLQSE